MSHGKGVVQNQLLLDRWGNGDCRSQGHKHHSPSVSPFQPHSASPTQSPTPPSPKPPTPQPPTHPLLALLQLPPLPQVRLPGVGPRQSRRLGGQLRVHVQPAAGGPAGMHCRSAGLCCSMHCAAWACAATTAKQSVLSVISSLPTHPPTYSHTHAGTSPPLDVVQHLVAGPPGGDILVLQAGAGRGRRQSGGECRASRQTGRQAGLPACTAAAGGSA